MKSPERYLALPVFQGKGQQINSSKVGTIRVPATSKLDMGDVFDGRSLCMLGLDRIVYHFPF